MVFSMGKENLHGLMVPNTRVSSETTKSLVMVVMTGLMQATMKVKFLTVSDMARVLTQTLKKEWSTRAIGRTD
jgi:hypothetical protein